MYSSEAKVPDMNLFGFPFINDNVNLTTVGDVSCSLNFINRILFFSFRISYKDGILIAHLNQPKIFHHLIRERERGGVGKA